MENIEKMVNINQMTLNSISDSKHSMFDSKHSICQLDDSKALFHGIYGNG